MQTHYHYARTTAQKSRLAHPWRAGQTGVESELAARAFHFSNIVS
jgi:hypothetical protein